MPAQFVRDYAIQDEAELAAATPHVSGMQKFHTFELKNYLND